MKIMYKVVRRDNHDIVYYSRYNAKEIVNESYAFTNVDDQVCVLLSIYDADGNEIDDTGICFTLVAFIDKVGDHKRCADYMDWMFSLETNGFMPSSLMTTVKFYDGEYHGEIKVNGNCVYKINNPCPDEIIYMMKQKLNEVIEGRK